MNGQGWEVLTLVFAVLVGLWTVYELRGVLDPKSDDTFSEWIRSNVKGKPLPTAVFVGAVLVAIYLLAVLIPHILWGTSMFFWQWS